jgi:G-protein alpha subunit
MDFEGFRCWWTKGFGTFLSYYVAPLQRLNPGCNFALARCLFQVIIWTTLSTDPRFSAAWVPFFDDMDAIIFLAPISCFDQCLAEDPTVNRLARICFSISNIMITHPLQSQEDSVLLWRSVVSNPLLKKTNLILFLNKCDILRDKLAAGVKLSHYVVSYGNRPNDFETASNCKRTGVSARRLIIHRCQW